MSRHYERNMFRVPQRGGAMKVLANAPSTPVLLPGGEIRHVQSGGLNVGALPGKVAALPGKVADVRTDLTNKVASKVADTALQSAPAVARPFLKPALQGQVTKAIDAKVDSALGAASRPGLRLKNTLMRKLERAAKARRGDIAKLTRTRQFSSIPAEQALSSLMQMAKRAGIDYNKVRRRFRAPEDAARTSYEILRRLRAA